MLFSLLLVTVNSPQFINEFAKTRVMAEMEHYFIPSADENSFINQPITVALSRPPHAQTHSVVVLCSCVLWLIILLQTDPQILSREHKQTVLRFVTDGVLQVTRSSVGSNVGMYSTARLRYTNAYFYLVLAIHLLFSLRLHSVMVESALLQSLFAFCSHISSFMFNPDFVAIFVTYLHIAEESLNSERLYFASLVEHGNDDIRRLCLARIRSELTYHTASEEFVMWSLPLVCLAVGKTESLTALAVSILDDMFVNTRFTAHVVSYLRTVKDVMAAIVRLPDSREFLYRLLRTDAGFQLCEEHQFVSDSFDEFMVGAGLRLHPRKRASTTTSSTWRTWSRRVSCRTPRTPRRRPSSWTTTTSCS